MNIAFKPDLPRSSALEYYVRGRILKMKSPWTRVAQFIIGEHDFASFCAAGFSSRTTVPYHLRGKCCSAAPRPRPVSSATGNGHFITWSASCRNAVEIGEGKISSQNASDISRACDAARCRSDRCRHAGPRAGRHVYPTLRRPRNFGISRKSNKNSQKPSVKLTFFMRSGHYVKNKMYGR